MLGSQGAGLTVTGGESLIIDQDRLAEIIASQKEDLVPETDSVGMILYLDIIETAEMVMIGPATIETIIKLITPIMNQIRVNSILNQSWCKLQQKISRINRNCTQKY